MIRTAKRFCPEAQGCRAAATLGSIGAIVSTPKGLRPGAMPQSLSAVYLHLVFSTKGRLPLLADGDLRARLHSYLGAASRELDCPPLQVGGVADHVHILARNGRETAQAGWVKEIKRVSSRWLKTQGAAFKDFEWQGGYAVFSVSPSTLERVRAYVADQERHHRRFDYQGELRALPRRHGLEWDERHLWD